MAAEMRVVVQEGLNKGELRLEQVAGEFQLVADSKDTLQALLLGFATMPTGSLQAVAAN